MASSGYGTINGAIAAVRRKSKTIAAPMIDNGLFPNV
jgi:hypothetical protein